MTTYYVGPGGNDGNAGTSWGARKLTLNGAEDIPVVAGDTVYVGPGTYRELLTVDVSGSSGSPITYIGDYTGANTDGVGGIVRITGSDNDQTTARGNAISGSSKDYRTFQGFVCDTTSSYTINVFSCDNWIVEDCTVANATYTVGVQGFSNDCTIRRCMIYGSGLVGTVGVNFVDAGAGDQSNTANVVENCIILGTYYGVNASSIGGVTVRNCIILGSNRGVSSGSQAAGQTVNVNNCQLLSNTTALYATSSGEITEDYNNFYANNTARTNTSTGSNSTAYPPLLDMRWWMEMTLNGGTLASPFDLASYSQFVELNSGTGAPSADVRGTTVQGTYREWGPLEYDSTLDIEAGAGGGGVASSLFGGGIVR